MTPDPQAGGRKPQPPDDCAARDAAMERYMGPRRAAISGDVWDAYRNVFRTGWDAGREHLRQSEASGTGGGGQPPTHSLSDNDVWLLKWALQATRECYGLERRNDLADLFARLGIEPDREVQASRAAADAGAAFKAYVHQRLDAAGIPTHPDGPHSKEGCRVGDRLDIALAAMIENERLRAALERLAVFRPQAFNEYAIRSVNDTAKNALADADPVRRQQMPSLDTAEGWVGKHIHTRACQADPGNCPDADAPPRPPQGRRQQRAFEDAIAEGVAHPPPKEYAALNDALNDLSGHAVPPLTRPGPTPAPTLTAEEQHKVNVVRDLAPTMQRIGANVGLELVAIIDRLLAAGAPAVGDKRGLREALEFYASADRYHGVGLGMSDIDRDTGKRARDALAAAGAPAATSDNITDAEIDETVGVVRAIGTIMGSPSFGRDLQIRDAGEHGLGLVWADTECWAVMPDPFYTKDFLSTLRAQCNRVRRCKAAADAAPAAEGGGE